MENKETKYLEDLSSRIIKNSTIESPSFDFTDSVMSRVNAPCEKSDDSLPPTYFQNHLGFNWFKHFSAGFIYSVFW